MKKSVSFILGILILFSVTVIGKGYEVTYKKPRNGEYELTFKLGKYSLENVRKGNNEYTDISFANKVLLNQKGYALLPYISSAVNVSNDKNYDVVVVSSDYKEYQLDNPMLPSRGTIYRNQNPSTIPFEIAPESITDAWYPADLAKVSEPYIVRNLRGASVFVYPFSYNAKMNVLRVYENVTVKLVENKERPINPLFMTRSTVNREMHPVYKSIFVNYGRERALSLGDNGEILVICTDRDKDAIDPYIQWKKQLGFTVHKEIVAAGTNVKSLIKQKYEANKNILYVQLVGDWAEIQSDISPADWETDPSASNKNRPLDPEMGMVAGTDAKPDLIIGRFCANSAADVTTQVNKTIWYERDAGTSDTYFSTATGIASNEGPGDDGEHDHDQMENIWKNKLNKYTYTKYNSLYQKDAVTNAQLKAAINNGTGLINYAGHGNYDEWSYPQIKVSEVAGLTNGNKLPVIFSVACAVGQFKQETSSFAEAFLKKQTGGAVFFLGSTIYQPWTPPMRGQDYFNDVLVGGYKYSEVSGQNGIDVTELRKTAGSIAFNGLVLMVTESAAKDDIQTVKSWTIFGDASLMVRTTTPKVMTLSNEAVKSSEAFVTKVTSADKKGVVVSLSQGTNVVYGITDANGDVTINHSFTSGNVKLTATGYNQKSISKEVTIGGGSTGSAILAMVANSISDTDGNGKADYNEVVKINISTKNTGTVTAETVNAKLTTADSYITITDATEVIGIITANQTVVSSSAFTIKVAENVPNLHKAALTVKYTDKDNKTWTAPIEITCYGKVVTPPTSTDLVMENGKTHSITSANFYDSGNKTADYALNENKTMTIKPAEAGKYVKVEFTKFDVEKDYDFLYVYDGLNASAKQVAGSPFHGTSLPAAIIATNSDGALTFKFTSDDYINKTGWEANLSLSATAPEPIVDYVMEDKTVTVSKGVFFDSGNKGGNYSLNESLTMTFKPKDAGKSVQVQFTKFDVEKDYDFLYVYNGSSTSAAQVTGSPFSGTDLPSIIKATNSEGSLTFKFTSDDYINKTGWEANINMVSRSRNAVMEFALRDNYPNPFNPSTTINYEVPEQAKVKIVIYNLLGKVVRTLVDQVREPGKYSVIWNSDNDSGRRISSGIYFYRMETGKFVKTKKLMLLK